MALYSTTRNLEVILDFISFEAIDIIWDWVIIYITIIDILKINSLKLVNCHT